MAIMYLKKKCPGFLSTVLFLMLWIEMGFRGPVISTLEPFFFCFTFLRGLYIIE